MNEQTLITSDCRAIWTMDVNRMLRSGWQVVPGTMCISTAGAATHGRYSSNQLNFDSKSEFAVVLEREVPTTK